MNALSPIRGMILNMDGVTFRYPGKLQYPMDRQHQQAAGLVATVESNKSIHPFGPARRAVRRRQKRNVH